MAAPAPWFPIYIITGQEPPVVLFNDLYLLGITPTQVITWI